MDNRHKIKLLFLPVLTALTCLSCAAGPGPHCLTGAFLADTPVREHITAFQKNFGKKPFLVMVFVDWNNFVDNKTVEDINSEDCSLFITWEPWQAVEKKGIDYNRLLTGEYDRYITGFAEQLKTLDNDVYIRFAHEMNGNWYPWSGVKIGRNKYIAVYRYIKDLCDKTVKSGSNRLKWVFSVNWQDVPEENNSFIQYYPGDEYVDYIGIDGYNWGDSGSWSGWQSFRKIFRTRYRQIMRHFNKPVIITEFSSTSSGGDKAVWISRAMTDIGKMPGIKAFILFNVDKETDWSFPAETDWGRQLKEKLKNPYFKDTIY